MAQELIYPGSSSFFPGQTPFGIYDEDYTFQEDAPKMALWCARRLGFPIQNVELQDENFYACFEESVSEYSAQVNQFRFNFFLPVNIFRHFNAMLFAEIFPFQIYHTK